MREQEQFANQIALDHKEYANYLNEIESKYKGKAVVATLYELGRQGKSFRKDMRKVLLPARAIEMDHFLTINHQCLNCGKMYEIDEDATEQYHKALSKNIADRKAADDLKTEGANQLAEAITTIAKGGRKKKQIEE